MPYPMPKTSLSVAEDLLMEAVAAQALLEAVRLGLFDHTTRPAASDRLARALGLQAAPLEALLDLLAARGLLLATPAGYVNTPVSGEYLVSGSPLYQGKALELQGRFNDMLLGGMAGLLRGESSARERTDDGWSDPGAMEGTLQHALNGQLQMAAEFLADLPGFSDFRAMADLGGNHGTYSLELLARNPRLASTVLDLPHVVRAARQRPVPPDCAGRLAWREFDLLSENLPEAGCDLVLASHVLYACASDLDPVLAMVHAALRPGGAFAAHHFAPEGGASPGYRTAVELTTRLMGYATHYLSRETLESALRRVGFRDFRHTFTGMDGQTLLLVARKA